MLHLQDNLIRGRFLAELTREVFTDLEASKYQHAEMRISIYGRKQVRATALLQLAASSSSSLSHWHFVQKCASASTDASR
jgi:hypothetical protein